MRSRFKNSSKKNPGTETCRCTTENYRFERSENRSSKSLMDLSKIYKVGQPVKRGSQECQNFWIPLGKIEIIAETSKYWMEKLAWIQESVTIWIGWSQKFRFHTLQCCRSQTVKTGGREIYVRTVNQTARASPGAKRHVTRDKQKRPISGLVSNWNNAGINTATVSNFKSVRSEHRAGLTWTASSCFCKPLKATTETKFESDNRIKIHKFSSRFNTTFACGENQTSSFTLSQNSNRIISSVPAGKPFWDCSDNHPTQLER